MNHGTTAEYRNGCRCDQCRAANTKYNKIRCLEIARGGRRTQPAIGTQRRIRALVRIGWSQALIADACGWATEQSITELMRRDVVNTTTAKRVAKVYDALSMRIGPSGRSRRRAERKGWAPPLAWDDIDDPAATPYTGTDPHGTDVDDIVWLIRCGGTWDSISARLGIGRDGIDRALRRAGRLDMIAELARGGSRNQWNGEVAS